MEKEEKSQGLSHGEEQQQQQQRPKKKKTVSVPCRNFRRGHCRYGDLCIFQHAEAATPTSSSSPAGLAGKRPAKDDKERLRPSRHAPPPTLSSVCRPVSGSMNHGSFGASSSVLVHGGGDKDEVAQGMRNGGFTDEEVYELSLQGIKPSDPEAWDALDVLSGWDCDDDSADGYGDIEGRMMNLGFVGEDSDDDDDGIYELSLQGIKPWDSEARVAFDVLNGGGFFGPEAPHDS